jgi:hypothetical protein
VRPARIINGLKDYPGELLLLVGDEDEDVGRDTDFRFDELSPVMGRKQVLFVPGLRSLVTPRTTTPRVGWHARRLRRAWSRAVAWMPSRRLRVRRSL